MFLLFNNYFYSQTFFIKDMDLFEEKNSTVILENENLDVIKQIKIANSLNDKFFICFSNDTNPICIINDNPYELYKFQKIGCYQRNYNDRYKVFYFKDPDNFMLVSIRELTTTLLNSVNNSIVHCKNKIFSRQNKEYSIIYNNVYQVVNYKNFTNCNNCKNISFFKNIKQYEYLDKIKKNIDSLQDKEELVTNLNEFITKRINIDYIDENKELKIQKDEMTIAFTSTYIQKMNENN